MCAYVLGLYYLFVLFTFARHRAPESGKPYARQRVNVVKRAAGGNSTTKQRSQPVAHFRCAVVERGQWFFVLDAGERPSHDHGAAEQVPSERRVR